MSDSLSTMNVHNIFYIAPDAIKASSVTIQGSEFKHIKKVLRKEIGQTIYLSDGLGHRYKAEICGIEKSLMKARVLQTEKMSRKGSVDLTVGFAVVKGLRNDVIIEKGTELGVSRFLVFLSRYSVVKKVSEQRMSRFKKIAVSAMLQSQQYYLPEVICKKGVEDIFQEGSGYDSVLVADPNGDVDVPADARKILLLIGPEGGFTETEKGYLAENGARLLSLGPTRLRSETAALTGIIKVLTIYGQI
jgi:16S rRNA (uracil1498-N3)-methyltransferase